MTQYNVTGMSCAACSARVEKAVAKVEGVESVSVSLLTNSMGVEGNADSSKIIEAVVAAGYGASLKGGAAKSTLNGQGNAISSQGGITPSAAEQEEALADHETPKLKRRLVSSLVFLVVLMYFSMGHMMWNWPLPAFLEGNHVGMGLLQMILAAIIMLINKKFFISGFSSLMHRAPNMDTLVALGSASSFVWSVYALFAMTTAQTAGDMELVMHYMDEFYFESAAMILTLITVGKMLEARSKGKTTDALKSLLRLTPKTAVLLQNDQEITVPVEQVQEGDIFVVRPGESIPVDGEVLDGTSAVNEAALTGESIPVDKAEGDLVSAATINQSGFLRCRATRVGQDTTLSQIIQMVSDAAATKAPIAKIADKVSGIFVPVVISIALLTFIIWLLIGQEFSFALARGISVLVISCPCALGLATPVAIMVGSGKGAKNGILFKTAVSLEETGKAKIVVLDKTGTITRGLPEVTDLLPVNGLSKEQLLQLAASLEAKSEHPLSKAIMTCAQQLDIDILETEEFTALPGNGLKAELEGALIQGGSLKYIAQQVELPESVLEVCEQLSQDGKTPLLFTVGTQYMGTIAVADTMKEGSPEAIAQLQALGLRVVMLTGDNERTAKAIGAQAGVDEVIAEVLPDGKEQVIRQLQIQGKVVMVGDGINDAPSLTRADIGMAIGAGADVAVDAADVVLMKSSLLDVPAAIRLSRASLRNIHENLFWAFIYNIIGIPLAAGCFVALGLTLNPMFGAAAMSLSSFCVVSNALRLNLFKLYETKKKDEISAEAKKAFGAAADLEMPDSKQMAEIAAFSAETQTEDALEEATEDAVKGEMVNMEETDKEGQEETETSLSPDSAVLTLVLTIEGMMCNHCERAVQNALCAIPEVLEAKADFNKGTAIVKLSAPVDEAILKAAVEAEDYPVLDIQEI